MYNVDRKERRRIEETNLSHNDGIVTHNRTLPQGRYFGQLAFRQQQQLILRHWDAQEGSGLGSTFSSVHTTGTYSTPAAQHNTPVDVRAECAQPADRIRLQIAVFVSDFLQEEEGRHG